jgi:phosphoribosyl 1,2-cyclic phosphodiesterase
MLIKLCVLAGTSKGNSIFLRIDEDALLIDVGITVRKIESALKEISESSLSGLKGILITHEHIDHIKGLKTLSTKYRLKSWLTFDTYKKIRPKTGPIDTEFFEIGESFNLGGIKIIAYEIHHDAVDPVAFKIIKDDFSIGILLDCGRVTPYLLDGFSNLDILIIEANHSFDKLLASDYPDYLKVRILSDKGHLSNWDTANFIKMTYPKLVFLTHISENNNSSRRVIGEIQDILEREKNVNIPFLVVVPTDKRGVLLNKKIHHIRGKK